MSGRRAAAAPVALCLLALAFPACGNDEKKPPGPPDAAERKQDFVARADRVCAENRRRLAGQPVTQTGMRGVAVRAGHARRAAANTVDELRALNPPAADRAVLDSYLRSIEGSVRTLLPALATAARRGDGADVQRLETQLRGRNLRQQELAEQYGFRVCGRAQA